MNMENQNRTLEVRNDGFMVPSLIQPDYENQKYEGQVRIASPYAECFKEVESVLHTWEEPFHGTFDSTDSEVSGSGKYTLTDGSNSWMMVHNRAYSHDSSQTAISDGSCLSTASDVWAESCATCPTGKILEQANTLDFGYQDQSMLLTGLSNPATLAYQALPNCNEDPTYQQAPGEQMFTSCDPIRSGSLELSHDEAWNPLDHRVPIFTPSYTAFAPASPSGSLLKLTPNMNYNTKSTSSRRPPRPQKTYYGVKPPPKASKVKALSWQHIVINKGGLQALATEDMERDADQKPFGVRSGALDPVTKMKAGKMRKIHACWGCWILKVPCSEGKTCERCKARYERCSPSADQLCSRAGFVDYEELFFPDYLHSHLTRAQVETFLNEHTGGFTDIAFEVEVSTGSSFKPLVLFANIFRPTTSELLRIDQIVPGPSHGPSQLVSCLSAPVGLLALSTAMLKQQCKDHIEDMISDPEYASQTAAGDVIEFPYLVLAAIRKYQTASDNFLLRSAMMLHTCQHFMSSIVSFSSGSALHIQQYMQPFEEAEPFLSSRLLNRQLKYVMHKLHREITRDVLEGLEKLMRQRTKDSWGPSLCTILIISLCIEKLQTAADTFITCDIRKSASEGVRSEFVRNQSIAACEELDRLPFHQCMSLFHDIYRSHKDSGAARESGLNPFRSLRLGEHVELEDNTMEVVRSIDSIFRTHHAEITVLSLHPIIVEDPFIEPSEIKANSTGRLVATFLASLIPPPSD